MYSGSWRPLVRFGTCIRRQRMNTIWSSGRDYEQIDDFRECLVVLCQMTRCADFQASVFSAATATVVCTTISDFGPDPNATAQVLLTNMLLVFNHTSGPILQALVLPTWTGPSVTVMIWVQSLVYASLTCSLLAALGAILGIQWLSCYDSVGELGTLENRCKERQKKSCMDWKYGTESVRSSRRFPSSSSFPSFSLV